MGIAFKNVALKKGPSSCSIVLDAPPRVSFLCHISSMICPICYSSSYMTNIIYLTYLTV